MRRSKLSHALCAAAKYDRNPGLQSLYKSTSDHAHPFSTSVRLQLIAGILNAPVNVGGAFLKTGRLLLRKRLLAFFPLHNKRKLNQIAEKWISFFYWPNNQPLWDIR